jgi:hypothetical protein
LDGRISSERLTPRCGFLSAVNAQMEPVNSDDAIAAKGLPAFVRFGF